MSGPNFVLDKGYQCAAAVPQFTLVKLSGDQQVTPTVLATDQSIGVCQEVVTTADATAGRVADIRLMGITRVVAGAAITRGSKLRSDTTGRVVPLGGVAGVNEVVVGIALVSVSNVGDHLDMYLTFGAASNAAVS